jgi:putative RNA 2'-phosphotransferase
LTFGQGWKISDRIGLTEMVQNKHLKQLAKLIAYILERRPDEFGLVTDSQGYIKIKDLLKALSEEEGWRYVRRSHLNEILMTFSEPPFEISDQLIRAKHQEHLPKHVPVRNLPKILHTCIRRKAYHSVALRGIYPSGFSQIILSSDRGMAERIGKRIDQFPICLTVQVHPSAEKGVVYYQAGEILYLAEFIPVGCFSGPPLPKEKPVATQGEADRKAAQPWLAGSFLIDMGEIVHPLSASNKKKGHKRSDIKKIKKQKRKRQPPPWRR